MGDTFAQRTGLRERIRKGSRELTYLDALLDATRARVTASRVDLSEGMLKERARAQEAPRGFRRALSGPDTALVAEIKRSSPSKGPLDPDLDAGALAQMYAKGGAAAISVVTVPDGFGGSLSDLRAARAPGLPVLRKDFIVDSWQIYESRAEGADAVLLIVRALDDSELRSLITLSEEWSMDALVEVHDRLDLERAVATGALLIGVNHRDLATFEVDPDRTAELAPHVPPGCTLVALSGVSSQADVRRLSEAGAAAVLVGESLVTDNDPEAALRRLRGAE